MEIPMKNVLIALDYGPTAQKVAEKGFAIAKAMQAHVVLLHVITDPVYYASRSYSPIMGFGGYVDVDFLGPDLLANIIDESAHFLAKTRSHLQDENIQIEIKQGEIAPTILETATKIKADFIVLGTHSRRWMEEILVGSTAHKLIKHSKIPMYIIPVAAEV
jgi:nucleotide-binding universal stress UspA family protein